MQVVMQYAATNSVGTIARGLFLAVETVDNSSGSAGDLQVRCAIGNTYVYAEAGGAIKVGEAVKADANSDCVVATGKYLVQKLMWVDLSHMKTKVYHQLMQLMEML